MSLKPNCDQRKCYLSVLYQGTLTPAVFSDPEQTSPFVFSCSHQAGDTALQILVLNHAAWEAGKFEQPLQPWDFRITYLTEDAYKESEPSDVGDAAAMLSKIFRELR